MNKKNISEIHPLSYMQQSLLMHHLHVEEDQGFLQVQCRLKGSLKPDLFREAFHQLFLKHKALRTSIHWENLSNPIQVVHQEFGIPWYELDWTHIEIPSFNSRLNDYLEKDKSQKIDLSKVPLSRIHLIKLNEAEHYFIWTCHHILIDGWSSTIALKDVLRIYSALNLGQTVSGKSVPAFFDYLHWIKGQDSGEMVEFWNQELSGSFKSRFFDVSRNIPAKNSTKNTEQRELNIEISSRLKQAVQEQSIGLNIFFQGIWAVILGKMLSSEDVVFGSIYSGRSGVEIDNLEESIGNFVNVLPTRVIIRRNENFFDSLRLNQARLSRISNYEFINVGQLSELDFNIASVDSLFVFQNFKSIDSNSHEIKILDYSSGLTTTFPLTIAIIPDSRIKVTCIYDSNRFKWSLVDSIMNSFEGMIELIVKNANPSVEELIREISINRSLLVDCSADIITDDSKLSRNKYTYEITLNSVELGLLQIWESVLKASSIGIDDDFFELGGTSLQAVIVFNKINERFGINLSITKLLIFPTIRKLAREIEGINSPTLSNCIIPLKAGKSSEAIYCLHSVSGDILHYKDFIQCIKTDRPVFGIQPYDDNKEFILEANVLALAEIYADEIIKNQPEGSYSILSYCHTGTLSIEIAQKLIQRGNQVDAVVMIDPAPFGLEVKNLSLLMRMKIFLRWIWLGDLNHIFKSTSLYINEHILHRFFPSIFSSNTVKIKAEESNEFEKALKVITRNHRVEKPEFKVVYIGSNDIRSMAKSIKGYRAWREFLNDNMISYHVDGDHHLVLEKPFINKVAEILEHEIKSKGEIDQ